jgi:hypothetical protein
MRDTSVDALPSIAPGETLVAAAVLLASAMAMLYELIQLPSSL